MTTNFLKENIWERITREAKQSKGDVAVAYFGGSAAELLPLLKGSTLIVDMSNAAVRSGQTSPNEILKLIRNKVKVYNVNNLHAKVFVFRNRAFIGSTNVSRSSSQTLVEAVIETTNRTLIRSMREFVRGLAAEEITPAYARLKAKEYKPPKGGKSPGGIKQPIPTHAPVKIVRLVPSTYTEEEKIAEKRGALVARKRKKRDSMWILDNFRSSGQPIIKRGDIVIQVLEEGKDREMVYPPARILHLQKIKPSKGNSNIIFFEIKKGARRKDLKILRKNIGRRTWNKLPNNGLIRNSQLAHLMLKQFASIEQY